MPSETPPKIDGTYLKNYGVVFQASLPPMLPVKSEPAKPASQPLSEWERTRKELHGEKLDKGANFTEAKSVPDLTDFLVKLVAENGRNFVHLNPKENVTIVVTFRHGSDPHASIGQSGFSGLGMQRLASAACRRLMDSWGPCKETLPEIMGWQN